MGGHSCGGLFKGTSGDRKNMETASNKASIDKRDTLLNKARTQETRQLINELYRKNSKVGDGGTADAIRSEKQKNEKVGGKSHILKGRERLKQIEKILEKNPHHPDRKLLKSLRDDLKDALGGE